MTRYPQYRLTQWLDNSDEAMGREQATIIFGVQTMRAKGGKWLHVHRGGEPLLFATRGEASAACDELRAHGIGWTELRPSETDKSPHVPLPHGDC